MRVITANPDGSPLAGSAKPGKEPRGAKDLKLERGSVAPAMLPTATTQTAAAPVVQNSVTEQKPLKQPKEPKPPKQNSPTVSSTTTTGLLNPNLLSSNSQLAPSTRSVTDDELASKQMENITGKDSVMRQRAETYGKNYAASRGLLDSSIGAQATFGAFVDRAAPLAMADAERYGQVADQNLGYENQFKLSDKNYAQQGLLQKDNQVFTSGENALDRKSQADLQKGDQKWRSGENDSDRSLTRELSQAERDQQIQLLLKQQGFAAAQNDLDRNLSREEIASRERAAVAQSKAELEKLGISMSFDKLNVSTAAQNQIYMMLLQQAADIRNDPNLDPASKENAIRNATDAANAVAKTISDASSTPIYSPAQTFDPSRASQVLVDEAARQGYTNPNMAELNMAMEYARANNLTEEQMRAFVRDTLRQPEAQPETPQAQSSPQDLMALAAQYGYTATQEQADYIAQYAAQNGLSAEEVVMQELRARGIQT